MSKVLVRASVDYVQGHLRYGHYELHIDKDVWEKLSKQEQIEELEDSEFIVDDYRVEDMGDITEITVEDVK